MDKQIMINQLQPHVDKMAEDNAIFRAALSKENKSMEECIDYIVYIATQCECKTMIMDGNEVMQLMLKYYTDDAIVMPNMASTKPKDTPKAETPKQKVESKQKAEKKEKAKVIHMASLFDGF